MQTIDQAGNPIQELQVGQSQTNPGYRVCPWGVPECPTCFGHFRGLVDGPSGWANERREFLIYGSRTGRIPAIDFYGIKSRADSPASRDTVIDPRAAGLKLDFSSIEVRINSFYEETASVSVTAWDALNTASEETKAAIDYFSEDAITDYYGWLRSPVETKDYARKWANAWARVVILDPTTATAKAIRSARRHQPYDQPIRYKRKANSERLYQRQARRAAREAKVEKNANTQAIGGQADLRGNRQGAGDKRLARGEFPLEPARVYLSGF